MFVTLIICAQHIIYHKVHNTDITIGLLYKPGVAICSRVKWINTMIPRAKMFVNTFYNFIEFDLIYTFET